ncbi:MAG: hypothetical protein FWF11_04445 [Coriobacteriia bacterium]|nr:hypothetical protein [Coriobacteriia bacterium]
MTDNTHNTYLIVGTPITHSLSPLLHNAVYRQLGLSRELRACDPKDGDGFQTVLQQLRAGIYQGFCVTIPYKGAAAAAADAASAVVQRTAAANYLRRNPDGSIAAENTDVQGFLCALDQQLQLSPAGLKVCVCGSGGAARAVCDALTTQHAAQVTLVSRKPAALTQGDTTLRILDYNSLQQLDESFDLLVNATPVGMNDQLTPLPQQWTNSAAKAVFDLVYRASGTTPLVTSAREQGIPACDGRAMLVEQAILGMHFCQIDHDPAQLRSIMESVLATSNH